MIVGAKLVRGTTYTISFGIDCFLPPCGLHSFFFFLSFFFFFFFSYNLLIMGAEAERSQFFFSDLSLKTFLTRS